MNSEGAILSTQLNQIQTHQENEWQLIHKNVTRKFSSKGTFFLLQKLEYLTEKKFVVATTKIKGKRS